MSLWYRQAPSSVRHRQRCRPPYSNIFPSETTGPIKATFHAEHQWDKGTKVCSNDLCHKTKMADMPIYAKILSKIYFSGTKRPMTLKLGIQHLELGPYIVSSNDDLALTMTVFTARPNLLRNAFVWRNA